MIAPARWLLLLVAVANLCVVSDASAQSSRQRRTEARERFEKGVELYESGDVRAALIEFKRAYKAVPHFRLLYNMAQAAAELSEYVEAYDYYLQYLGEGGSRIDAERRREVRNEIKRLEGYLATVRFSVSEAGAEITVDGVVVGISPMQKGVVVSAGRREVAVTRQGFAPWRRRIDLAGRVTEKVRIDLVPLTGPGAGRGTDNLVRRSQPDPGVDTAFWTSAAVTTLLAVGTGYMAYSTLEARDEYELELARVPNTVANVETSGDRARQYALLTDVGLGLTVVGLTATILLAARDRSPDNDEQRFSFLVSPNQVAVMGQWRY